MRVFAVVSLSLIFHVKMGSFGEPLHHIYDKYNFATNAISNIVYCTLQIYQKLLHTHT